MASHLGDNRDEKWHPTNLLCQEFKGEMTICCGHCHQGTPDWNLIRIYPPSVYSTPWRDKSPDLGMGLMGLVCCQVYDEARAKPRAFWVHRFGVKNGYEEADIQRLVNAAEDTRDYLRLSGEIASKYFKKRNPSWQPRSQTVKRAPPCPKCGFAWGGTICTNCGFLNL